jgi:potassium uptake TrkH family protein
MPLSKFKNFKRRYKMHISDQSEKVGKILQFISLFISLITVIAICYYNGFYLSKQTTYLIHLLIFGSLLFYVVKYLISLLYSLKWKTFFRETRFEAFILGFFILNFLVVQVFDIQIGFLNNPTFGGYYILFIQVYFLFVSSLEIAKASGFLTKFNLSPPGMMLLSFLSLIIIGTALLSMPRMTTNGISFIDALFTSTSASCVTGLTVINTGTDFTLRGQVVILFLIQLGGLSILSFASFFASFFSTSQKSLKQQYFVKDFLSANKTSETSVMVRQIIISTLIIEATGVGLLFINWKTTGVFNTDGEAFYYALFHTISAYNNAGFSLWNANFMDHVVLHSYFPQFVIMILVFLGGIGFFVLSDFFSPDAIRERKKFKWKQLMPCTKIVLQASMIIIVLGSVSFFILEYNNALLDKISVPEKIISSIFQTIVSRTAGFNLVEISIVSAPTLIITMLIMFIGASPGSTAGGIKTTTAFVIFKSVVATIKGKKHIEFQKKTIPFELVDKSYSIIFMSFIIIFISVFTLSIFEPTISFLNLLFESVSAFATCGLSTGCTPNLSDPAKGVLIFDMFIGRVGTLTFAFALSKRIKESHHIYPSTYFMVG